MESLIPCFRVCLCCLFLSQQCHSRFPRRRMWGCCFSCWCPSARFRKAACNVSFWCFPSKLPWTFRQKKNLQLRLSLPSDLSEMHCVQAVQRWMRISTWKKNKKEKENKLQNLAQKKSHPHRTKCISGLLYSAASCKRRSHVLAWCTISSCCEVFYPKHLKLNSLSREKAAPCFSAFSPTDNVASRHGMWKL